MKKAWDIARTYAKKIGGNAIEYISVSLKEAWRYFKEVEMEVVLHTRGKKSWVAKVVPNEKFRTIDYVWFNENRCVGGGKVAYKIKAKEGERFRALDTYGKHYFTVINGKVVWD